MKINVNLGDNFPEFKKKGWFRKHFPLNRPRDIFTAIASIFSISFFSIGGTVFWTLSWGTWLAIATIAYSVWSMLSVKKSGGDMPAVDQNGQLANTRQAVKVLPVVYGVARVGGNWVISRPSGASNAYLNSVITWSEGPIEGVAPAIDYTALFTGSGLDDLHISGDFVFPGNAQQTWTAPDPEGPYGDDPVYGQGYGSLYDSFVHYRVKIDSIGAIDTFKWSDDGGTTWKEELIPITTEDQNLNNGVTVKFEYVTDHGNNEYWDFYAGDGIFLGERLLAYYQNYGGTTNLAYQSLHYGSTTQTPDSRLQNEIKEWNEALRNTAYSYFRLVYDANAWKSIPDFTAVIKGRLLYDPRDASTVFSRNPALVWLDFLTNTRYGLGVPTTMVDMDSVEDVANWCNTNGYYFDGVILDRKTFLDNFEDIMLNFRAFTVYSEGVYYLKVFTDDTAVMTLTDADVQIDPESFVIKVPGIPESPLRVQVTFADRTANYTANTTAYPKEAITQEEETLEREASEKTLIGVNTQEQAQKIARFGYMKRQFDKTFSILSHPRCFVLEPGDMVQMTHEFPGWTTHKARVETVSYPQEGMVPLVLTDESSTIYTGDV